MRLVNRLVRGFSAVMALWAWAATAAPHELGTVQVEASFQKGGAYSIQILVDAEHLRVGVGPAPELAWKIPMFRVVGFKSAISGLPELSKMPWIMATGPFSDAGRRNGDLENPVNPPCPSPLNTEIELSPWLAT